MFKNHIELIDEESVFQQSSKAIIEIDNELCKQQKKFAIGNVDLYFPHKPYDVQMKYMESVVQVLNEKCNGLLESPTVTGKTLGLLCTSLGWLESNNLNLVIQLYKELFMSQKIHSQLKQVAQEQREMFINQKYQGKGIRISHLQSFKSPWLLLFQIFWKWI